jgi:hypothetical protein
VVHANGAVEPQLQSRISPINIKKIILAPTRSVNYSRHGIKRTSTTANIWPWSPTTNTTPSQSLCTPTPGTGSPKAKTPPTPPLTAHPKSSYISFADLPATSPIFRVFPPGPSETKSLLPVPVSYKLVFDESLLACTHYLVPMNW